MKQSETKGRLVKTEEGYNLHIIGHALESLPAACFPWDITKSQLSKQNCDEIFGMVDVEKLFLEVPHTVQNEEDYWKIRAGFIEGFNKAMELNKDKVFTAEDMEKAYLKGVSLQIDFPTFQQSIQQPKEIKVIVVEEDSKIKSDENGCLILRKDVS